MSTLKISTKDECWVVPESVEFVKLMITRRQLTASRLLFRSDKERQSFIRKLSLLALRDECEHQAPSIIAELSRKIVQRTINQG